MTCNTTESEVRHIAGRELDLDWLEEIASVYSSRALQMDWYRHEDLEVICCLRGRMVYEFGGHAKVVLKAGFGLVIPSGVRHRLSSGIDAPSRRVSFRLRKSPVRTGKIRVFSEDELSELRTRLSAHAYLPFALAPEALSSASRLGHYLHRSRKALSALERCDVRMTLCSLFVTCTEGKRRAEKKPTVQMMSEAVTWLETNYGKRISLNELINHMGYGRSRFFELFKAHTGLSPNDYLIRLRIAKAQALLKVGTSVRATASAVGFADPGFFSKTFRRQIGQPPSDFSG